MYDEPRAVWPSGRGPRVNNTIILLITTVPAKAPAPPPPRATAATAAATTANSSKGSRRSSSTLLFGSQEHDVRATGRTGAHHWSRSRWDQADRRTFAAVIGRTFVVHAADPCLGGGCAPDANVAEDRLVSRMWQETQSEDVPGYQHPSHVAGPDIAEPPTTACKAGRLPPAAGIALVRKPCSHVRLRSGRLIDCHRRGRGARSRRTGNGGNAAERKAKDS